MLTKPALDLSLIETIYEFGRHLGMAFQLIDDVLDFVADEKNLGKPAGGADLQMGVATGPVLFAAQSVSLVLSVPLSFSGLRDSQKMICSSSISFKSPNYSADVDNFRSFLTFLPFEWHVA